MCIQWQPVIEENYVCHKSKFLPEPSKRSSPSSGTELPFMQPFLTSGWFDFLAKTWNKQISALIAPSILSFSPYFPKTWCGRLICDVFLSHLKMWCFSVHYKPCKIMLLYAKFRCVVILASYICTHFQHL